MATFPGNTACAPARAGTSAAASAASTVAARVPIACVAALACAALLAACGKPTEPTEIVRPVRALQLVSANTVDATAFSGEVRPRIESRLGFRVAGKIVRRNVDIGALVKAGQVLASLDPRDLQLQSASAQAQVDAARSDRTVADADLRRYEELKAQGFISGAQLEQKQNAANAARARFDQAAAAFKVQGNQTRDATLLADADGVVTGVDAEVGQVVSVGQSVLRVAQTRERELAVSVPEQAVAAIARGQPATIRIWSRPNESLRGVVREIAPAADPATRTYAVRIALPDAPAYVLIGMTGSVRFGDGVRGNRPPTAPLSALYRSGGGESGNQDVRSSRSSLWVIDPKTLRVHRVEVTLGDAVGNSVIIADGVKSGEWIVTAGVNLLKPDQRVTILSDSISGAAAVASPGAAPQAAPNIASTAKPGPVPDVER